MHALQNRSQAAPPSTIVDLIGGTPVMALRRIAPPGHGRVLVKLEATNPTGSMKDRAALAIVRKAAESGRLQPSGTIVECTSGSTGTSLASVAVALGYRCLLVSSDAFSSEKLAHMRALGAELELVRTNWTFLGGPVQQPGCPVGLSSARGRTVGPDGWAD